MGNPARPRAAVPPLIKKPANSGRRYSARYWRRGSGKRSFWRAVRTRLTAISFSPAGKYTNRGKWGFTQAPPACSCGTRTPEAFFRQNKKQTSHINSFFQKGSRTAVRQSRRYGLHRSRYPKQEAGPRPPHQGQRLYHARPMSAGCPHAAREQRSKNKNVRILIYNLHFLS